MAADAYGMRYKLPTILDNMIADHRLPVMVAVMIDNGGSERSMECDTVSGKYVDYVEAEVLLRAEKEANVKLTKYPEGRMTLGGSSCGAVAFTMAWFKPGLSHGAWEYPEHLSSDSAVKPLRVWMEVAQNDKGAGTASEGRRNWVILTSAWRQF